MRQSQQNRRSRGRSNNSRKSQSPLTRSYESNGPDVKIRGTPSHIAEKYVSMARDALSSGDPVLAENYLQHAEHYNRIIMTYREQQGSHSNEHSPNSAISRHRNPGDPIDDDNNNAADNAEEKTTEAPASSPPGSEPQPSMQANEAEARPTEARSSRRSSSSRDRGGDRAERSSGTGDRERSSSSNGSSSGSRSRSSSRRSRYAQSDDQPEFLKRPVRAPRSSSKRTDDAEKTVEPPPSADQAAE